jgi:hypothetical protein
MATTANGPHGNSEDDRMLLLLAAVAIAIALPGSVLVQSGRPLVCTGVLVDVDLKPKADFPTAVIAADQGYTCLIDRGVAGHDPLRPCISGSRNYGKIRI